MPTETWEVRVRVRGLREAWHLSKQGACDTLELVWQLFIAIPLLDI